MRLQLLDILYRQYYQDYVNAQAEEIRMHLSALFSPTRHRSQVLQRGRNHSWTCCLCQQIVFFLLFLSLFSRDSVVGSLTHFCLEILHRTQTSSTELFTTVFFIDHLHISSSSLSFKMNSVISPQTPCPSIYTSQTPSIRLITNYLIIYNNWRSMSPNRSIFVLFKKKFRLEILIICRPSLACSN